MWSTVVLRCEDITLKSLPEYRLRQETLHNKKRDTMAIDDALRTLKMTANEEQQTLLQNLIESYGNHQSEMTAIRKDAEDSKSTILEAKHEIRNCIKTLVESYVSLEAVLNDSREEQSIISSEIAILTRDRERLKQATGVTEVVAAYENDGDTYMSIPEEEAPEPASV
jgi:hypothetical protein